MCTQRHKTWNFWNFFKKTCFFQVFKKQKWQKCAKPARTWGHRSGILKYYFWLIFWDKKNWIFEEKKIKSNLVTNFWIFFWKFFENFQFSNMHKTAKWGDWVIKIANYKVSKPINKFWAKFWSENYFRPNGRFGPIWPKKRPFLGHFFEIATNVVFSNRCWQHAPKVFFGSISVQRTNLVLHTTPQSKIMSIWPFEKRLFPPPHLANRGRPLK